MHGNTSPIFTGFCNELHADRGDKLYIVPVFIHSYMNSFLSYETVASILGPSNSGLAEADHQPKPLSSLDATMTPSDEFFQVFTNCTIPIEDRCEASIGHTAEDTEERLLTGKVAVETPMCTEGLLPRQQTEVEQDEVRVVLSSCQLEKG